MHPLAERVSDALARGGLVPDGEAVLAAVSGGGDSVALLHLLSELAGAGQFPLAGVVHVNHGLRGSEADGDEQFCRELATRFDTPCIVHREAVADWARRTGMSIERAGHEVRHRVFAWALEETGAARVAVGHTMDDQAETVLLRTLRGAGATGLSGMHPRTGSVIRPLLDIRRVELREYLEAVGASFREDASNQDRSVPRNRVRHELLPELRGYSPRIVETLAREAEILRKDEDYLATRANELARTLVKRDEGTVLLDRAGLSGAHPALARRVVRDALAHASPQPPGFEQVERVRGLVEGRAEAIDLPGCRAETDGRHLRLTPRRSNDAVEPVAEFAYRLDVPGVVAVRELGISVGAELVDASQGGHVGRSADSLVAAVRADVGRVLTVRNRRPGDRFRPLGLGGHRKKLQDLFVDRKVERAERARVPLVVDASDRIMWVAGHGIGHDFRITSDAASVIILKVSPLGEVL
mgnify:CR=1 FL=1